MASLDKRRILLGITGGIAAYKSAELVRRLRDAGAEVRVVMTQAAQAFITPLTLQVVSGQPVRTSLLDPEAEAGMGHIELARWADAILIAPASANCLARLAHGLADDLLATLCLATEAPLAVAPAMNRLMWAHPATQANRTILERRGVRFFGPAAGEQACGEVGEGRMVEPDELVAHLTGWLAASRAEVPDWSGRRVLITAGPTREPIDPVRYLTNHSSGRMGFAVAEAAAAAGAEVMLVTGPVSLATPPGVTRIDVTTAAEMHAAVMDHLPGTSCFIGAAAVADYRPRTVAERKIKKGQDTGDDLALDLERTPDILADVARAEPRPFTVGFAAETDKLHEHADAKRRRKRLDLIAANWVGREEGGFDRDENALDVLWEGGSESLPMASKSAVARQLIALIDQHWPY